MPVRKIGINTRSVTGRHGFSGQQYESTLERDLLDLLEFDYNVDRYETQPLIITYVGGDGRIHRYTPDVLVLYPRTTSFSSSQMQPRSIACMASTRPSSRTGQLLLDKAALSFMNAPLTPRQESLW